ncbi:signal recognition particle protein [Candidatus Micrarchaeota archaeon]|nr:signal recognition particle protein [Candidatus Micrarchaeota archaeon]
MDLGQKLREALAKLTNKPYVSEEDVKLLVKELQRALISSDVNVKLVLAISKRIEERALKSEKLSALSLKEHVMKVVYDELALMMGESYSPRLDRHKILVCGLYGSGKTTSCGKIAHFYRSKGLSVGLVGADTDRPAAREQLEQIAKTVGATYYTNKEEKNPARIVKEAMEKSKDDVLIVDSAGRSAFDEALVGELKAVADQLKQDETFLVLSADIGQIAGKQATEFNSAVPLSGVIVTKMDGSGKGGGALSAVGASNAKIAFIGVGEKPADLEIYNAQKFVGRLLGVPDFEGLLEKIKKISEENDLKKIESDELTIETFYDQLKAMKKLGPLGNVMSMMGLNDVPKEYAQQSEEKLKKFEAMIGSMTRAEKKDAKLLKNNVSRIGRIARGSGCTEKEVKEFLNQFEKMEKMVGMFKHNRGFRKKMEKMMSGVSPNIKMGM